MRAQIMADGDVPQREVKKETESGQAAAVTMRLGWRVRWAWAGTAVALAVAAAAACRPGLPRESVSFKTVPVLARPGGIGEARIPPDCSSVVCVWPGECRDNIDIYAKSTLRRLVLPLADRPQKAMTCPTAHASLSPAFAITSRRWARACR